jgi:hypothetical protein
MLAAAPPATAAAASVAATVDLILNVIRFFEGVIRGRSVRSACDALAGVPALFTPDEAVQHAAGVALLMAALTLHCSACHYFDL